MFKFSSQLIERFQKHFIEKHNAYISNDEAQTYLDSLASLYLLVVGQTARQEGPPRHSARRRPPVILDSLHTQSDEDYYSKIN